MCSIKNVCGGKGEATRTFAHYPCCSDCLDEEIRLIRESEDRIEANKARVGTIQKLYPKLQFLIDVIERHDLISALKSTLKEYKEELEKDIDPHRRLEDYSRFSNSQDMVTSSFSDLVELIIDHASTLDI